MRILIAEDDELILRTVEHRLKREGWEVLATTNGKEAIEKIRTTELDLVVTDIMMPFASGLEILSAIKELEKQIPVIMLSAMGQEDVILNAFALGAADFIIKPFSPNELLLRVKRFNK